ncbi:MAG: restriction endonuclease subunit S [Roseburia sp.]|nr:restriction endonuclease subunit S [Roseburia sp.]
MEKTIKDLDIYISDGNYSSKYPRSEEFVEEGIPFIRGNNMVDGDITDDEMYYITPEKHGILLKGHVKAGDVLITTRGNIGQVAIVSERHEDSNINAQIVLLRTNPDSLYNRYLLWALQSKRANEQYLALQTGTALKQLPVGKLENLSITVTDINEQHYIANILDKVYEVIKARRKELLLLDDLIKARFVELFGNPLDKSIANKYFVECVEFNPKKSEVKDMMDETVSFVPMECVGVDGSFTIREDGLIRDYYKGYTYFRDGDVLLAKITPCFENGKVAIAENCTNSIGFGTTEFHVSRPIAGVSNSYWIKYMLKNNDVHDLATINMTGSAGQKRIQTPFFEKLKIYLPPIELQNQFADFVKQVDKSKVVVQKALSETQMLFDSLMQKYFG